MATINSMNTYLTIGPNKEINKPIQPCFFAYLTADALNITGDITDALVPFNATLYNIESCFSTVTSKFTASITAKYCFGSSILLGGIAAQTTGKIYFNYDVGLPGSMQNIMNTFIGKTPSSQLSLSCFTVLNLTVGQTCRIACAVTDGAKVVDVIYCNGSYFLCYLIA